MRDIPLLPSGLRGTLIDCAILSRMTDLDETDYADKDNMIHHFASSIAAFSDSFIIGRDYRNEPVPLNSSLQFVLTTKWKRKAS